MLRLTALAVCCTLALGTCSPKGSVSNQAQIASASAVQTEDASLTVKTARGEVKVPQNPERIAVYDLDMPDTLNKLGVKTDLSVDINRLPYLDEHFKTTKPTGTLFEPGYEALNAYKLQLIIIGSRAAKASDKLNEIAPTVEMTAETVNLKEGSKERIDVLVQISGKQAEADKLKAKINASFDAAKTAAQGKGKGLMVLVNGGKMSAFGPFLRLDGWLRKDIGVPAVDESIKEGSHGQLISLEYSKEKNPDWLFVLDRGAAISEEGQAVKDVLNNPLVAKTNAWREGQVVYLVSETYLAVDGAQELLNVSKQVADALNAVGQLFRRAAMPTPPFHGIRTALAQAVFWSSGRPKRAGMPVCLIIFQNDTTIE